MVGFSSISFRQRAYGLIFGFENKPKGAKGFPWGTGGGIPQGKALNEIGCTRKDGARKSGVACAAVFRATFIKQNNVV